MNHQLQFEPLTDQELEILRLKAQRLSNKEIANRLVLAVSTVKWYISRIYRKLDVSNRREAISRANELGLLQADQVITKNIVHNLPAQQTPFIGRKKDIDQLSDLLQNGSRLTTILGTGGSGKTRLAIKVAELLLIKFTDGVYFVPLAPLSTSQDILTTIAFNIEYQFVHDGRAPKQQLLAYLQDKLMLLIIDNFEHVLEGSLLISEILSIAPNLVILATSRERLNLHSETSFAIRGLNYPQGMGDVHDAMSYDAVQLFIQSARRAHPNFSINDDNIGSVITICELVDGLPLGIELAARWADHLSAQDIAIEIQRSIDILHSDYRDMPLRLRSIRATLNYSWEQLLEQERLSLARLSVFKGGFTLDSSQHVARTDLITLHKLTGCSMLRQNPKTKRYDMHPLVQQYAEEKLDQIGEMTATCDAHLDYFVNLLLTYQEDFVSKKKNDTWQYISDEIDNIRSLWHWGVKRHQFAEILSVIPSISLYYRSRSLHSEFIQMLQLALSEIDKTHSQSVDQAIESAFQVLLGTTMATSFGYGAPEVGKCLEKAHQLSEETSNTPQKLPVLVGLYNYYHVIANYHRANEIAHSILELSEAIDNWAVAKVAGYYGISASNLMLGNLGESLRHGELVLQLYDSSMESDLILLADVNLGAFTAYWVALAQQVLGYSEQAENTMRLAIEMAREGDHAATLALVLSITCYLCHVRSDLKCLKHCATESIQIAQEHDLPFPLAQASIFYGYSEALAGNVETGLNMIEQSMGAFQAIGSAVTEGYFRALKAEIYILNDQKEKAIEELRLALDSTERINERWYEAEIHRQLGEVYRMTGDSALANQYFQKALTLSQQRNAKWYELRASLSLYELTNSDGSQRLRSVVDWFDEGFDMPDLKKARGILQGM